MRFDLEAEVERLRSENSRLILTQIERDRLRDEVERLRAFCLKVAHDNIDRYAIVNEQETGK